MAVGLSPVGNDAPFFLSTGVAASGAKLFIYNAGSTTKTTSYQDSGGITPNANPVLLNSSGYPASGGSLVEIWLTTGSSYKFVLAPSTDTDPPASAYWTRDNVPVLNDVTASVSEWTGGPTPTYVSATQFTLVGDQTGTFLVGRRIKAIVTAGTVYGIITASAFTSLTTVTVIIDAGGALDSGLSAVSYGLLSSANESTPPKSDAYAVIQNNTDRTKRIKFDASGITTATQRTITMPDSNVNLTGLTGTQSANSIFSGPSTGAAALPGFRAMSGFDIPLRSYLSGLGMSTAGGSGTMSIAVGQATDSTQTQGMVLGAGGLNKTILSWAVGSGSGGLDTGSIAGSTWYHFFLIMRPDTGVVDVLISLSASAPTMPANYTLKRRIGSGKTDGGNNWTAFIQDGDYFTWLVAILDVNTTNPGTSAISETLTVPTGVTVYGMVNLGASTGAGTGTTVLLSDLSFTDAAPSQTAAPLGQLDIPVNGTGQWGGTIRTNTSAQIRLRARASDANVIVRVATMGWLDRRGRDA